MPWGQNNDSLAAFSWKKKSKMENLSYFNLNSTEDCGERGRVTSFIASTFDQCFLNSFVPSGIKETGIFCVQNWLQIIDKWGRICEDAGWVVPPTHESSGGCWMQMQLSRVSKDDCIVRDLPVLKITDNLHIIISVGLEWAVKRKDDRVWSLVMSKKSLAQGREGQNVILHQTWFFWVSDSFFQRSFLVIFYSGIEYTCKMLIHWGGWMKAKHPTWRDCGGYQQGIGTSPGSHSTPWFWARRWPQET